MKRLLVLAMLLSIFLSACAQATPTADPAQIQASAVAAANTMVALTQAAMPTETSVPPTPLPSPTALPSPTLLPLPTLSIGTVSPQTLPTTPPQTGGNSSNGSDPCSGPLVANPDGPQVPVHVSNTSHDPIIFSIWLSQKTSFGECGYRGFALSSGGSASITMPVGCYGAGASVNGKKPHNAFGNGCSQIGGKLNVVVDDTDVIKFR